MSWTRCVVGVDGSRCRRHGRMGDFGIGGLFGGIWWRWGIAPKKTSIMIVCRRPPNLLPLFNQKIQPLPADIMMMVASLFLRAFATLVLDY